MLQISKKNYDLHYVANEVEPSSIVECILPAEKFTKKPILFGKMKSKKTKTKKKLSKDLEASRTILKNKYITINFDILGKISSISHKDNQFYPL